MINVGERIEELLRLNHIPKKDLMEALGISRQGLHHKMKTNTFKSEELQELADFFKIDLQEFLKFGEPEKEESKIDYMFKKLLDEFKVLQDQLSMKDQQINKLLDILGKLDPISEQARVLNLGGQYKEVA